jgi:hypothetical protein
MGVAYVEIEPCAAYRELEVNMARYIMANGNRQIPRAGDPDLAFEPFGHDWTEEDLIAVSAVFKDDPEDLRLPARPDHNGWL